MALPRLLVQRFGRRELKLSLKTTHPDIARLRTRALSAASVQLIAIVQAMSNLSPSNVQEIARWYLQEQLARTEELALSGSLTKQGVGTATLSGTNTYAGGTVTNNAALVLDQATNGTMANAISGTGSLTKKGSGALSLTGSSSLSGSTIVEAGRLAVIGGSLGGTGVLGGIVAQSGGAVAPGNSIGTLNVAGNVSFGAGSVYQVEVNATGQSDRIAATGTATLTGGTVQVLAETGTYRPSTTYTILTAAGGVSGTLTGVSSNFAFLTPSLGYDPTAVSLTLSRTSALTPSVVVPRSLSRASPVRAAAPPFSRKPSVCSRSTEAPTNGSMKAPVPSKR
ncbi:autotransporter outer membrane beta-barrel domain-containing protein [Microvirga sp. c23x22]|uniref:Autotransporter outer membrane beta-barrel domain-containing protein n=2 Tax=Microvirga terricola TaxID=2719797 RepID=A0ABX0VCC4_9HYPH|nr:autotransporter outer membrane beta-barrel domain-containing protein [Microvirga terricola]